MINPLQAPSWRSHWPTVAYLTPFVTVLLSMVLLPKTGLGPYWEWPIAVCLGGAACAFCWPRDLPSIPARPMTSIAIGAAVFVIWISPDLLFPGYRHSVFFSNAIMGHVGSSIPPDALRSGWVLAWRTARAVIVVPIAEELFWRGWLLRWLVKNDFESVALGAAYAPLAFWVSAALFASEHGPYWDVGLLTGIIYNLWMARSKSLADCVLMHAVTNGLLSAYVILHAQWQYWQ